MTKAEQKKEEIRLLNLKVNDLKKENSDYSAETKDLIASKELSTVQADEMAAKVKELKKEIVDLQAIKEPLAPSIARYNAAINELSDKVEGLEAKRAILSGELDKLQDEIKNKGAVLEGLKLEIDDSKGVLEARYASVKGFEEQLLIKEALLNKRIETLDLKEQGVKISK